MKVKDLILTLEEVLKDHGDIDCLIEINDEYGCSMRLLGEVAFEDREGYGPSVAMLE